MILFLSGLILQPNKLCPYFNCHCLTKIPLSPESLGRLVSISEIVSTLIIAIRQPICLQGMNCNDILKTLEAILLGFNAIIVGFAIFSKINGLGALVKLKEHIFKQDLIFF